MSEKRQNPTDRPPFISFGKKERQLLECVNKYGKDFRRRAFSNGAYGNSKVAPTTAYDGLKRLESKGLIEKLGLGVYSITEKGKDALGNQNKGSEGRRKACRGRENISMHKIKFTLNIKNTDFVDFDKLDQVGDVDEPVQMQNWFYYRLRVNNATLRLYPNKIVGEMTELVGDDVEKLLIEAMDEIAVIGDKFSKIGLFCDTITLDKSEFAEVESVLGNMLVKRAGKYRHVLDNGHVFWIDFSGDNVEHETDDPKLASRLGNFLDDLKDSNSLLSDVDTVVGDIDELKKLAQMMLQHDLLQIKMQKLNQAQNTFSSEKGDYFG